MGRPTNREIERHYFDRFCADFVLPSGEIVHGDKPDVVIRGYRDLGIEIANLYLADGADPSSEQVQRKRREAVVRDAQKRHFSTGGRRFELTVAFNATHPITDTPKAANSLATIASNIGDHVTGKLLRRRDFQHIPELADIYLNPKQYPDARWRVSQVFTVPSLSVDRVREVVAKKNRLLADYQRCDAYWLLLVVDFMDSAQDQGIVWPEAAAPVETAFERVLVYKPQSTECLDIPIERPKDREGLADACG